MAVAPARPGGHRRARRARPPGRPRPPVRPAARGRRACRPAARRPERAPQGRPAPRPPRAPRVRLGPPSQGVTHDAGWSRVGQRPLAARPPVRCHNDGVRPTDDTRERTLATLRRGYASGSLHTDTFGVRIDKALRAQSEHELRGLTADVPAASRLRRALARLRAAIAPQPTGLL